MISRIYDQRIVRAQLTGFIEGVPTDTVLEIALVADLLLAVATWPDTRFMFDGLARHGAETFKVPVEGVGWMLFEWVDGLGPVNLRLNE